VLAGVAASAVPCRAQQRTATLAGRILDRQNREPVHAAVVTLLGTNRRTATDSAGVFQFPALTAGTYRVRAIAIGYDSALWRWVLPAGDSVVDTLLMTPHAVVLDRVEVEATELTDWRSLAAVYRRRERGTGHFIMTEEIDSRNATDLKELLQSVPGLITMCAQSNCRTYVTRSGGRCQPEFFLDGFPASFAAGPDFPSRFAEAVEIYLDASEAPVELQRPGLRCGIIAIWTRRRR